MPGIEIEPDGPAPAPSAPYEGAGAGMLALVCAAVVFWRAMFARASMMFGMPWGAIAGLADPACGLESKLEGGLPGGVVESPVMSTIRFSSHKNPVRKRKTI